MDERNIIEQVLAGDNEAFGVLVERYQTKVYNLALRITGNEDDAADMAQEAFLRAWRSLKAFQFESSFSTWLFRLTHNVCIDHLRAKQRKPSVSLTMQDDESLESVQLDLPDPGPDPEQALLLSEDRSLLVQALMELPTDHREILTMRAINDMSYQQIAQVLHLQEGTVKSRLSRARAQLRKKLQALGNNSEDPASNSPERRMRDAL